MNNNEFLIRIAVILQRAKSKKQINTDIQQLKKAINMLGFQVKLVRNWCAEMKLETIG